MTYVLGEPCIDVLDRACSTSVFNGCADQYEHAPLQVRAGERVRVWTRSSVKAAT